MFTQRRMCLLRLLPSFPTTLPIVMPRLPVLSSSHLFALVTRSHLLSLVLTCCHLLPVLQSAVAGPRGGNQGSAQGKQQHQQHWPFSFGPACPLAETLLLTVKASNAAHAEAVPRTPLGTVSSIDDVTDGRNSTVCLWAFGRRRNSGDTGAASLREGEGGSAAVHVEAAELSLEESGYRIQDCAMYKVRNHTVL